jgi:hypothetical protein
MQAQYNNRWPAFTAEARKGRALPDEQSPIEQRSPAPTMNCDFLITPIVIASQNTTLLPQKKLHARSAMLTVFPIFKTTNRSVFYRGELGR